jgi:hypothetical protein
MSGWNYTARLYRLAFVDPAALSLTGMVQIGGAGTFGDPRGVTLSGF